MLMESHIRRVRNGKQGSNISLGETQYRFEPVEVDGPHVCEVKNEAHIARLLEIRECFTKAGEPLPKPAPPPKPVAITEIPDEPSEDDLLKVEEELDIELQMCETIVGMTVREAVEQLSVLSVEALDKLATMEVSGQARTTLLAAIDEEQEARKNPDPENRGGEGGTVELEGDNSGSDFD